MGPEGKRRLELRNLTNAKLFELYDSELVLHLHAAKNLSDTRKILASLQKRLGDHPPSPDLAKSFLVQYANRQPRTLYRYTQMVKAFMKWYGEPITDLKIKIPKSIPKYNDDVTVNKVREAIGQKKTHKKCIARDELLFDFDRQSGLRRAELGNLLVKHVHTDFVEVRKGKGNKDRIIPLTSRISDRLQQFIDQNHLKPEDRLFGLTPASISNKIRQFADKAGVPEIHAHSLRHKFATDLLEGGTNIRVVQDLLGHENLNTTQVYLSINNTARQAAIRGLEENSRIAVREQNLDQNQNKNDAISWSLQDRHQKNMLKIVERWRTELFVSFSDIFIKDLFSRETLTDRKAGLHCFSKSSSVGFQSFSLNWQVKEGGIIYLCYPLELETDPETRILRDYLFDHIRSNQYTWVLNALDRGMVKWKELGGQELKERTLLLNTIESKVEKITRDKIINDDLIRVDRPGPTKWFVESICASIVDNIYNNLPYYPVEVRGVNLDDCNQRQLFKAQYGARNIGYETTKAGAEQYQEWHRQVMMGFQSDVVSKIKQLKIDSEKVIQEVDEVLARLMVDGQISGKCDGCPRQK